MFEDFTRAQQLELTKNWQDPNAYTVTAVVLYRRPTNWNKSILNLEFLITKRLKGAAKGYLQSHHGGHAKPTDQDMIAAAIREVRSETGYQFSSGQLQLAAIIGPELYRSTLKVDSENFLELTILDIQAEPTAPFVATTFIADATHKTRHEDTDGEVRHVGWMSLQEIIHEHGQSMKFNYFNILVAAIKEFCHLGKIFPPSQPGTYRIIL